MDSEVVVGQMRGYFHVNSADLRQWHWRACALARRLPQVRYCLVPREWNHLADGLAGQAMMPWHGLVQAIEAFNAEIFTKVMAAARSTASSSVNCAPPTSHASKHGCARSSMKKRMTYAFIHSAIIVCVR